MFTRNQIQLKKVNLQFLIALLACLAIAAALITLALPSRAAASNETASQFTHYLNILGYEGIGTLGSNLTSHGTAPPVGDYVTTHCRYIDVPNTGLGQYYLRYPLHLPDGATITEIKFKVADFNPTGVLWFYLRSRNWNSRDSGDTHSFTLTNNDSESDKLISMKPSGGVQIDSLNKTYWIDVSPTNGADPGQLCVYGIQVIYNTNGLALPVVVK